MADLKQLVVRSITGYYSFFACIDKVLECPVDVVYSPAGVNQTAERDFVGQDSGHLHHFVNQERLLDPVLRSRFAVGVDEASVVHRVVLDPLLLHGYEQFHCLVWLALVCVSVHQHPVRDLVRLQPSLPHLLVHLDCPLRLVRPVARQYQRVEGHAVGLQLAPAHVHIGPEGLLHQAELRTHMDHSVACNGLVRRLAHDECILLPEDLHKPLLVRLVVPLERNLPVLDFAVGRNGREQRRPHVRAHGLLTVLLADVHGEVHVATGSAELDERAPDVGVWLQALRRHAIPQDLLGAVQTLTLAGTRGEEGRQDVVVHADAAAGADVVEDAEGPVREAGDLRAAQLSAGGQENRERALGGRNVHPLHPAVKGLH
mmetsp:Transcript_3532/g.8802  ORF Transcript_3532/g.8802 Transcript_3532/m.8802 type:complete len:372 (-) Transcript_3532:925-2040(-)